MKALDSGGIVESLWMQLCEFQPLMNALSWGYIEVNRLHLRTENNNLGKWVSSLLLLLKIDCLDAVVSAEVRDVLCFCTDPSLQKTQTVSNSKISSFR